MSASKRIAFAVTISWLSKVSQVLSAMFLTPILFRFMGKEELGLWYLLGNSQAFLALMGLGIAPTLTRHIALAKGKSGSNPSIELTEESKQHIGDLVATGQMVLQGLAVVVFFIAWGSGYGLINQIKLIEVSPQEVFWAWALLCAGYAVGVWVSYLDCLIAGMGYVGWDSAIATVIAILTILTNIAAVLLGGGLLALSAISLVAGLIQRFVFLRFIRWRLPELFTVQGKWNTQYAKALVKPSLYWWLTDLGAFLSLRTDLYFITLFKGTQNLPSYQAAYTLVANLYQIAFSLGVSSSVFISQAWQAGDLSVIHRMTLRNAKLGLSIMAVGVVFLMMAGRELIELWLGEGNFVGYSVLLIFCIMLTLEAQHGILAVTSRATDDEKYAPWSVASGILNLIFTWILIKPLGLVGVAMGTMLAQLLTSNWYCVYRPMVRLNLNFGVYLRQVVGLWATVLFCCLSLSLLVKKSVLLLGITSDWAVLAATSVACGAVLSTALWKSILEEHHRRTIQVRLGGWLRGCL
jgi:O-antigen/teichoic acid export membrane protein